MEIKILDETDKISWQNFINSEESTKTQHLLEMKEVIQKTYDNCKPFYYALFQEEKIKAIFPFFLVKSKIFGNRMISLPFLDVGGFLGEYNLEEIKIILDKIKELNEKEEIRFIEIRLNTFIKTFEKDKENLIKLGFKENPSKQQFIIKLTSEEGLWNKFHKYTRKSIRKSEKSGLKLQEIKNEEELKRFYKLYLEEMKEFGSPQHSYEFFQNLFEIMKGKIIGFNSYFQDKMIGSLIFIHSANYGYIMFNVSNREYREYKPNDLLYWGAIKFAIKNNVKYVDLGQIEKDAQEGTHAYGLYEFKRKWLGEIYNRIYFNYSFEESDLVGEKKEKYKKLRKMWSAIPSVLLNKLGPKICGELGI